MIFYNFVRGPFHREDFNWQKYGGMGLISEKTEILYAELNLFISYSLILSNLTMPKYEYPFWPPLLLHYLGP